MRVGADLPQFPVPLPPFLACGFKVLLPSAARKNAPHGRHTADALTKHDEVSVCSCLRNVNLPRWGHSVKSLLPRKFVQFHAKGVSLEVQAMGSVARYSSIPCNQINICQTRAATKTIQIACRTGHRTCCPVPGCLSLRRTP